MGNGDGTFGVARNIVAGGTSSVITADLNEDGNPDLAVAGGNVSVLMGNGDGTFGAAQNVGGLRTSAVTSADFNGDSNLDLAAGEIGTLGGSLILGKGDGTFLPPQIIRASFDVRSITSADFNADQKPDLATANQSPSNVSVLLNTTPAAAPAVALSPTSLESALS